MSFFYVSSTQTIELSWKYYIVLTTTTIVYILLSAYVICSLLKSHIIEMIKSQYKKYLPIEFLTYDIHSVEQIGENLNIINKLKSNNISKKQIEKTLLNLPFNNIHLFFHLLSNLNIGTNGNDCDLYEKQLWQIFKQHNSEIELNSEYLYLIKRMNNLIKICEKNNIDLTTLPQLNIDYLKALTNSSVEGKINDYFDEVDEFIIGKLINSDRVRKQNLDN